MQSVIEQAVKNVPITINIDLENGELRDKKVIKLLN